MLPYFRFTNSIVGKGRIVFYVLALASLVLCAAFTNRVSAQSLTKALTTTEAGKRFEAVGRLMVNGNFTCSATLIAPKRVVTAAHCVVDDNNSPYPPETLEFQLGFRVNLARAYRQIRRIAIHPDFDIRLNMPQTLKYDLALLEIHHPISKFKATPLKLRQRRHDEDRLSVASYARSRENSPTVQFECSIAQADGKVIVLNCPSDHGASGAPILSSDPEPEILGIISAKGTLNDRDVSLGVSAVGAMSILENLLSKPR